MIEVRNDVGVLLRYDPTVRPTQALPSQPSDRLRCLLRRAARQAVYLRIMVEHIEDELSEVAIERFGLALDTIQDALDLAREETR